MNAKTVQVDAAALVDLLSIGTSMITLVQQIKAQTQATAPEVWDSVSNDYAAVVDAWNVATGTVPNLNAADSAASKTAEPAPAPVANEPAAAPTAAADAPAASPAPEPAAAQAGTTDGAATAGTADAAGQPGETQQAGDSQPAAAASPDTRPPRPNSVVRDRGTASPSGA